MRVCVEALPLPVDRAGVERVVWERLDVAAEAELDEKEVEVREKSPVKEVKKTLQELTQSQVLPPVTRGNGFSIQKQNV